MDILSSNLSNFSPRTDLALEVFEDAYGKSRIADDDGIESFTEERNGVKATVLKIKNQTGAGKLSKPIGTYITLETGNLCTFTSEKLERVCDVCAQYLSMLIPKQGSCLMACLGNKAMTADAQGPLCAESFIVTRHIKENSPELFENLFLRESACIVPNVLGSTGVEAANIVKGVAEKIKPDFIIAVDSLAAKSTSRLGATLQISDAGICPGSGVGNHRMALNRETLGVPVIAVGVPTVIDAATIGAQVLEQYFQNKRLNLPENVRDDILQSVLCEGSYNYFVTPKNADTLSLSAARLIALSVNKVLNPDLSYGEMAELCGR